MQLRVALTILAAVVVATTAPAEARGTRGVVRPNARRTKSAKGASEKAGKAEKAEKAGKAEKAEKAEKAAKGADPVSEDAASEVSEDTAPPAGTVASEDTAAPPPPPRLSRDRTCACTCRACPLLRHVNAPSEGTELY